MGRGKFAVYGVFEDGRVSTSEPGGYPHKEISASEVEDLMALMSIGCPCHALSAEWDPHFPGHGRCFLVDPLNLDLAVPDFVDGSLPFAAVVRFGTEFWRSSHLQMSDAYGLSDVERRLALALADKGNLEAFNETGEVGSATARNALSRLRRKLGTPNLAGTVTHLLDFLFDAPGEKESIDEAGLAMVLGIAPRRFHIANLLTGGVSRSEVAKRCGHSVALVKSELSLLYEMFEVQGAAELAAVLGQARVVADEVLTLSVRHPRLREWGRHNIIERPGGRRVGYSLFGQPGNPLVHITHSNITCRHPPTRLVSKLVQGGRLVLVIDRPGYGDTSPPPVRNMETQIACAVEDLLAVLDAEKLGNFTLLARSSGQIAVAYANAIPERIDRVVIVNGLAPANRTDTDRGPLGALKRRFIRNPSSIRLLIGILLKVASTERIKAAARRSMSASAPDLAALDDPLVMEDYLAAVMPLKQSLDGYTLEVSAWAQGWDPVPHGRGAGWEILMGAHFVLHDPRAAIAHLREILPEATIHIVRDGGTMLAWSHPDLIAEAVLADPLRDDSPKAA